jgi:hypothetical protein
VLRKNFGIHVEILYFVGQKAKTESILYFTYDQTFGFLQNDNPKTFSQRPSTRAQFHLRGYGNLLVSRAKEDNASS